MLRLVEVTDVRRTRICVCGEALVGDLCPLHGTESRVDSFFVESLFCMTDSAGKMVESLNQPIKLLLPENQFLQLISHKGANFGFEKCLGKIIYEIELIDSNFHVNDLLADFFEQIDCEHFFEQFEIKSIQVRSSGIRIHYFCAPSLCSPSKIRLCFTYLSLRRLSNYISWRKTQTRAEQSNIVDSLKSTRSHVYSKKGVAFRIVSLEWAPEKRLPSKIIVSKNGELTEMLSTDLYQTSEHFFLGTRTESEAQIGLANIAQRFIEYFFQYLDMHNIRAKFAKLKHDTELYNEYNGKLIFPHASLLQQIGSDQNQLLLQKQRLLNVLDSSEEKNTLLLVACSATKDSQEKSLPAILRYLGASYMPLKAMLIRECWPKNIELMIISAKYGLIRALDPLPYYDERLSEEAIEEKQTLISQQIETLDLSRYETCLVNLPKVYVKLIEPLIAILANKTEITISLGRSSERNDAMVKWLIQATEKDLT